MADCVTESEMKVLSAENGSTHEDENYVPNNRDDYVVQVKAQVMTRDDSSGGWVPSSGGGMSMVGLRATPTSDVDVQYLIDGRRVSDHTVILNCVLQKDLSYMKATPTFHHWRTQGDRFGLTFHSSADAQVFERCIQKATDHMLENVGENISEEKEDEELSLVSMSRPLKETVSLPGSRARTPSPASSMRIGLRSGHISSTIYHPSSYPHLNVVCSRKTTTPTQLRHSSVMDPLRGAAPSQFAARSGGAGADADRRFSHDESSSSQPPLIDSSYVQFSKTDLVTAAQKDSRYYHLPHDYSYPMLESIGRVRSTSQKSLDISSIQLPLPKKKSGRGSKSRGADQGSANATRHLRGQRLRCVYCRELFVVADNHTGQCPDRADGCVTCIEAISCIRCARGALYHLAADEDGDYGAVCICNASDPRNRRKWVVLSMLSVVLPCLLCYPLMMACHRCAVKHGRCGARHKAE